MIADAGFQGPSVFQKPISDVWLLRLSPKTVRSLTYRSSILFMVGYPFFSSVRNNDGPDSINTNYHLKQGMGYSPSDNSRTPEHQFFHPVACINSQKELGDLMP